MLQQHSQGAEQTFRFQEQSEQSGLIVPIMFQMAGVWSIIAAEKLGAAQSLNRCLAKIKIEVRTVQYNQLYILTIQLGYSMKWVSRQSKPVYNMSSNNLNLLKHFRFPFRSDHKPCTAIPKGFGKQKT